jgi:hypothetical protein
MPGLKPAKDPFIFLIAKRATGDDDNIDDPPDAQPARRAKHQDTRAGLPGIKSMDTQITQKKAQQKRY